MCLSSPHPLQDARSLEEGRRQFPPEDLQKEGLPSNYPRPQGRQWGGPESQHPRTPKPQLGKCLKYKNLGWPRVYPSLQ